MIHPTRTNLLRLKGKAHSVSNSLAILKARRQALIREFLTVITPLLRSREEIRQLYRSAIDEMALAAGHEGREFLDSLAAISERDVGVDVKGRNVMGVRYRDVLVYGPFIRGPQDRNYDFTATSPHLEEGIYRFEKIVESMLEVATFESKLKRIAEEILQVTRRARVLEERLLPRLCTQIHCLSQYIAERERETHFRLKRYKTLRDRKLHRHP